MDQKTTVPFDMFAMRVDVPVSSLVRHRSYGWTCGQCALGKDGSVLHPNQLVVQVEVICDMIDSVIDRAGYNASCVGKLLVYYTDNGEDNEQALALLTKRFPHGPIIIPILVPHFYYDGMLVEIDVFAADQIALKLQHQDDNLSVNVIETTDQHWVSVFVDLTDSVEIAMGLVQVESLLSEAGYTPDRLLSDHWFIADSAKQIAKAQHNLSNCELVSSDASVVRIDAGGSRYIRAELNYSKNDAVTHSYSYDKQQNITVVERSTTNLCWLSGSCLQVETSLVSQTELIMASLSQSLQDAGRSFDDVVKLTAYYQGGASEAELHDNMMVRHRYYAQPGPASTGLPVDGFCGADVKIAIDIYASY